MAENKITFVLGRHFKNNFWFYFVSLLCFCTGIIIGIYCIRYMGSFEKSDLTSYLNNFGTALTSQSVDYKSIFLQTLKNNLPIIFAIWFLGLTLVGLPVILLLDLFKGFTLGFSISFIISQMGVKGIWISLAGIVPQNLIYIPAIIISSVIAMEFSTAVFKDRSQRRWNSNIWVKITSYSFAFLITGSFMFFGFFMESYLTPNIVKLLIGSIGG